jgi:peptide deformylase
LIVPGIPDNVDALNILVYPHPALREVADPVADPADPQVARFIERMRELLRTADGVGLAATQVGVGLRILLANPTREVGQELVVINPQIVETEGWQETDEGCLSLPGMTLKLRRRERVRVRFTDQAGRPLELDAKGFLATILQHEGDHLDGKMIIDRASMLGRLAIRDTLRRLESDFKSTGGIRKDSPIPVER